MSTLKVNTVESATTPTVLISDGLSVSGVSTLTGGLKVGSAITMSSNGNFGITGIMTASSFSGSLAASNLTGALPAISGASLTGLSPGITMADQWRTYNTQSISGNTATTVTSWERNDNTFAAIGSAMNESSGVWTFPTTGIYLVTYHFTFYDTSGNNRYITARMKYNNVYMSQPYTSLTYVSGETFANLGSSVILDVTDTSHELFFSVVSENTFQVAGNNWAGVGNENVNTCDVTFIRLGDT